MMPTSLMSHLFHFARSGERREREREHSRPPHSSAEELITNQQLYLRRGREQAGSGVSGAGRGDVWFLLVSGRAMCYLRNRKQEKKNQQHNDGDGERNLIVLSDFLALPSPSTGDAQTARSLEFRVAVVFQGGGQETRTSTFIITPSSRLLRSLATTTPFLFDNYSPLLANDSDKNKSPAHVSPPTQSHSRSH